MLKRDDDKFNLFKPFHQRCKKINVKHVFVFTSIGYIILYMGFSQTIYKLCDFNYHVLNTVCSKRFCINLNCFEIKWQIIMRQTHWITKWHPGRNHSNQTSASEWRVKNTWVTRGLSNGWTTASSMPVKGRPTLPVSLTWSRAVFFREWKKSEPAAGGGV